MENIIGWFEIPVTNLERAKTFYQDVFGYELQDGGFGNDEMAMFPSNNQNVSGALVKGENRTPGENGVLIYFHGGKDLEVPLSKVGDAGGSILFPKTLIMPEAGYFAIFLDSEGNQIGIHSMQ